MSESNHIGDEGVNPCTGCGVCSFACPVGAISMDWDAQGFYTPTVDEERCTRCGRCRSVCVKYEAFPEGWTGLYERTEVYAVISNLIEQARNVTTVGVATRLAMHFRQKGHAVCGAVYDLDTHSVKHMVAQSHDDLLAMRSSKYLQSQTACAFSHIVNQPEPAVVFGMPCQIYGLRKLLRERDMEERFLLVDLFCAGVPSQNLWRAYLDFLRRIHRLDRIDGVNFRDKTEGWLKFSLRVAAGQSEGYRENLFGDLFYAMYLRKVCNMPACYACPFRHRLAGSDLRLGDFWGPLYRDFTDGVGLVTIHTEKGRNAFSEVSSVFISKKHDAGAVYDSQKFDYIAVPDCRMAVLSALARGEHLEDIFSQYHLAKFTMGSGARKGNDDNS